ncbi:endonuclease III [Peptoniphilus catoniae]|uniref:endonuclease III n=1 Tax=Peptoniphilus catoniae TaxID=1660341 RepID=UPI0010FCE4F2|nr:endonuclease III [Peptoniphilus catoniae]
MRKILNKKEVAEVLNLLEKDYPDAGCELKHTTAFELLVATILSAQCTDVRVNIVTEEMFKTYNKPEDFVNLGIKNIEPLIKTCGLYKTKAKNIYLASKQLVNDYDSKVPSTIEELLSLPGVGQKTANVVASTAFGVPAIAVDTHVFRLANRIGLVNEKNVKNTELSLEKKIDKDRWIKAHHLLIFHGRRVCKAQNPDCENCSINHYCKYYKEKFNEKGNI